MTYCIYFSFLSLVVTNFRISFDYVVYMTSIFTCTVNKDIKYSRNSEILHEVVRDTTRTSEKHELILVVS